VSDAPNGSPDPFIKALGLRDVILMNVVAIVSLRWIARGARMGPASVTLWILACLAFFVPLAYVISKLSKRYPEQGGVYVWVRRAFGTGHGFVCGWCLWVNNLFYFPSLLLFGAANLAMMFGARGEALAASRTYFVVFVLAGIWTTALISIAGLRTGKWLQNAGSIGVWIPAGLLLWAGAVTLVRDGSATSFGGGAMLPRGDVLDTMGIWSAMCFAFSGFEITTLVGQEVRDARRTIPLGVAIAGGITTVFYIAGSAALLIAIPYGELRELSGVTDAVELVGRRLGLTGLGPLTGGLVAAYAIAGTASWTAGAARVPFAAGMDRAMPAAFARLHPRYRTPHVALTIQAAASTAIFLASLFLSGTGRQASVQEAYDILVNLTILIYFIPYLYLFAAFVRLQPAGDPVVVPKALAAVGFAATALSLALTFVPPPDANALTYELNLVLQAAVMLGLGFIFYRRRAPARTPASDSNPPAGRR
jgi:amino acid transporter